MARKKPHIHYIYKTTCNVTKRYYIGMHSTTNLEDGYLGSGKRLRYSIRKYGEENHTKEILEFLSTREELVIRESEIVDKLLLSDKFCMNLRPGGQGGFSVEQQRLNAIKSNEKQKILSQDPIWLKKRFEAMSKSRKKNYENGVLIRKHFFDWTGLKHSEKSKQKMSESSKNKGLGETNSQYGTCWITNGKENKKMRKGDEIPSGWDLGRIVTK